MLVMADFAFNATVTHVLLDLEGNQIDGFEFNQGFRTELFGSCSTAFKGSMYVFGGFVQRRQVSRVQNCGLEHVDELPFNFINAACQARLQNQVLLCFSDDAPKDCWRFDERDGEFVYQKELTQSQFGHEHNQMAMYHGNPLAIGSCWGLEVEMLDRHDEEWKRMADFPNPGIPNLPHWVTEFMIFMIH